MSSSETMTLLVIALCAAGSWALGTDSAVKLIEDLAGHDPSAAAEVLEVADNLRKAEEAYDPEPVNAEDAAFLREALEELGTQSSNAAIDDSIESINDESGVSTALFEGDIVLTVEQSQMLLPSNDSTREKRSAPMVKNVELWDKTKPIPYKLHESLTSSAREAIRLGLASWQANTCLRFQENGKGPNSLLFFRGKGCYANLGRLSHRAEQEVSIGNGCDSVGTAAHETAHALGFHHTHVRHDRDSYVVVNRANVKPDTFQSNFKIETTESNDNYGMPYEYGSIMHYSGFAFSLNEQVPTIVSRDVLYENTMGNRRPPTVNDILMMNIHYKCAEQCKGKTVTCLNGGAQNVNDCGTCICPAGFTGADCSERPGKCGAELTATNDWQTLSGKVGSEGKQKQSSFEECVWWIKGKAGKQVQIHIQAMYGIYGPGCGAGGLEIKAHKDMRLTGYVFCGAKDKTVVSANSVVPLIGFNNQAFIDFNLKYRLV